MNKGEVIIRVMDLLNKVENMAYGIGFQRGQGGLKSKSVIVTYKADLFKYRKELLLLIDENLEGGNCSGIEFRKD